MKRIVQPELLDELPPDDPRALHSRRDLQRINAIMGNAQHLINFLVAVPQSGMRSLHSIAELGAGDGTIASKVTASIPTARVLLIDRLSVPSINPSHECITADVFEWLRDTKPVDAIIANLFLHHFQEDRLRELLKLISQRCRIFAAVEPGRNAFAEAAARCVGLIGCNAVTRNDAVISVRAGFNHFDLSSKWPAGWQITERRAGLFSHFFGAIRQ